MQMSKNPSDEFGQRDVATHSVVYGLRNFGVDHYFRLTGVMQKEAVWRPGVNHARCYRSLNGVRATGIGFEPDHEMTTCQHGFYAYYDGSRDYHDHGDVTGIIKGWGRGMVGTRGFRVMTAQIMGLKFAGSLNVMQVARIVRNYQGIPVFASVDKLLQAFPLTSGEVEFIPEPDDEFWTRSVS